MPVAVSQLDRNGTPRVAQQPFTYVEMEVRSAYEAGCTAQAQQVSYAHGITDRRSKAAPEMTIGGHRTVAVCHHHEVGVLQKVRIRPPCCKAVLQVEHDSRSGRKNWRALWHREVEGVAHTGQV